MENCINDMMRFMSASLPSISSMWGAPSSKASSRKPTKAEVKHRNKRKRTGKIAKASRRKNRH